MLPYFIGNLAFWVRNTLKLKILLFNFQWLTFQGPGSIFCWSSEFQRFILTKTNGQRSYMNRFPQDGHFCLFCVTKKFFLQDHCGQTWFVAPLFPIVLWRTWLSQHTTSAPSPINSLQYNAMQSKCTVKSGRKQCILVNFESISVHCSELRGSWGWGSVLRK